MDKWTELVVLGVGGNASKENSMLFLDVGANVGIHGLYAAALGLKLWSVEPQIKNVEKVKQLNHIALWAGIFWSLKF